MTHYQNLIDEWMAVWRPENPLPLKLDYDDWRELLYLAVGIGWHRCVDEDGVCRSVNVTTDRGNHHAIRLDRDTRRVFYTYISSSGDTKLNTTTWLDATSDVINTLMDHRPPSDDVKLGRWVEVDLPAAQAAFDEGAEVRRFYGPGVGYMRVRTRPERGYPYKIREKVT